MLYAIYDSATDRWYKKGEWGKPGKPTKLWRQRGPLKLSLIAYMDMNSTRLGIPSAYRLELELRKEYPQLHWREISKLANKRRAMMLPETWLVYEYYPPDKPEDRGMVKDWY
jgi:hypothetical protein